MTDQARHVREQMRIRAAMHPVQRICRVMAVAVLLADPDDIPDDLEASLYAYQSQLSGQLVYGESITDFAHSIVTGVTSDLGDMEADTRHQEAEAGK